MIPRNRWLFDFAFIAQVCTNVVVDTGSNTWTSIDNVKKLGSTYVIIECIDFNTFQIEIPWDFSNICNSCTDPLTHTTIFAIAAEAALDENGKQPERIHQQEQYCMQIRKFRDGCVGNATWRWAFRMILKNVKLKSRKLCAWMLNADIFTLFVCYLNISISYHTMDNITIDELSSSWYLNTWME